MVFCPHQSDGHCIDIKQLENKQQNFKTHLNAFVLRLHETSKYLITCYIYCMYLLLGTLKHKKLVLRLLYLFSEENTVR